MRSLIWRLGRRRMLDRRQYGLLLGLMWLYALAWLVATAAFLLGWTGLGHVERILILVMLALVAPDISTLTCSYERYRREWSKLYSDAGRRD